MTGMLADDTAPHTRQGAPLRVCHFVHAPAIGGVETAVAQLQRATRSRLRYAVATLAPARGSQDEVAITRPAYCGVGLNNPLSVILLIRWAMRQQPDIVVASLWRAVITATLLKTVNRRIVLVVFLHSTKYKNIIDRIATTIGLRAADAVFCDSPATRRALVTHPKIIDKSRIVSLSARPVIDRIVSRPRADRIGLVFWGRIASEKRIDRAIRVAALLANSIGHRRLLFTIAGPDAGMRASLQDLAARLGMTQCIRWVGPASWSRLVDCARQSEFFVQLSDFEGQGMAVIEAMRLGLIPVVTPVGQITDYTIDGYNAIHHQSCDITSQKILDIWRDRTTFASVSDRAVRQWQSIPDTGADFVTACTDTMTVCRP